MAVDVGSSYQHIHVDNLYITAHYLDQDYAMKVTFLSEAHSDLRGAQGMLTAMMDRFNSCDLLQLLKEKLVGLTTDGEVANTDSRGGLWKRLKDELGSGFFRLKEIFQISTFP